MSSITVAVHVRDGEAGPVVVMDPLYKRRVVHDAVHERDPALLHAILKPELIRHLELADRSLLGRRARSGKR